MSKLPFLTNVSRISKIQRNHKVYLFLAVRYVHDVTDSLVIRVCAIHRPFFECEHEEYYIAAHIYHGTKKIGKSLLTQSSKKIERDKLWPARIIYDNWYVKKIQISQME